MEIHGIQTKETLNGVASVIEVSSSVIGVFGTSDTVAKGTYHMTTDWDEVEATYGEGSIRDSLFQIHNNGLSSHTVIGFPIGSKEDFPELPEPESTDVTLSTSSVTVYLDADAASPVVITNPHALELTYQSDNEQIATVDSDGIVTAVKEGVANITVSAERTLKDESTVQDSFTYSLTVEANKPVNERLESEAVLSHCQGLGFIGAPMFPVALSNPHKQKQAWTSDDATVAMVDPLTGEINALSEGMTRITVTLKQNAEYQAKTLTYELQVSKVDDPVIAAFIEVLPLMKKAKQRFGFSSKINIAPGILHKRGAAGLAVGAITGIRGIWVGDFPEHITTKEDAYAYKQEFTSQRLHRVWPRPLVLDEEGATVVSWAAPNAVALIAMVDRNMTGDTATEETGYWCSPSNFICPGVLGPSIDVEYLLNDATTDVQYLNKAGIASWVNHGGWKLFGNYTTAYPTKSDPLSFLSWRRTMDIIEESIEDATLQYLDRPMFTGPTNLSNTVMGKVRDMVNDYLRGKTGTALVYSSIAILKEDNPLSNLQQGIIKYRYRGTPPVPMQQVDFVAEVYVAGLEAAFDKLI